MTYLNFLILFVILPSLLLGVLLRRHLNRRWWQCVGVLSVVALVWTTPWDNYLVANKVWWYDKDLVLNLIIGYVPIEEYAFFVLQTIMTSLWMAGVWVVVPAPERSRRAWSPSLALILIGSLMVLLLAMRLSGERQYNYLILEIGWLALLPLSVQWLYGLDIILHHWRAWLISVLLPTAWLTSMDSIAIGTGTWSISEEQTIGLKLGGLVPIEEAIFFLITNLLIVQGMILFYMPESWERAENLRLGWVKGARLIFDEKLDKHVD